MAFTFPQTSVANKPRVAYAGMIADSTDQKSANTFTNANASAEIPFGVMVKKHATDFELCDVLSATSDKLAGVVVHSHQYNIPNELGTTGVKPKGTMAVLEQGHIYVVCDEAVVPGDAVRVRTTAVGGGIGTFRKTAVVGGSINISAFAQWVAYDATTGLAVLSVDMRDAAGATAD